MGESDVLMEIELEKTRGAKPLRNRTGVQEADRCTASGRDAVDRMPAGEGRR